MPNKAAVRRPFAAAFAILLLDAITKASIVAYVPLLTYHEIAPYFNVGHWSNTGAAFSFLADAGGWQRGFFISFGLAASVLIGWLITRDTATDLERVAYASILGGALGNVVDRVFRGAVVDWLDFHWAGWHWPAFNVADIGITIGAAVLLWAALPESGRNPGGQEIRP